MRLTLAFLALTVVFAGCAQSVRVIPTPRPGAAEMPELRIRNPDSDTQRICAQNGVTDCLDSFWRVEAINERQVVFRYRRVAMSKEDGLAPPSFVEKMVLVTDDGRRIPARLSERLDVVMLSPVKWMNERMVDTGERRLRPAADGTLKVEKVMARGHEEASGGRASYANYVVFDGARLVADAATSVTLEFKGGLLGGGARWVWRFDGASPENAELSFGPERDRPDLAKVFGAKLQR